MVKNHAAVDPPAGRDPCISPINVHTIMNRFSITAVALLLLGMLTAGPALGQQGVPPQQQVPDVEVDEAELQTVAEAYVEVQTLTNEFNQVVQQAEDAEEAQAIQAEYAERANEIVEGHDLTVERYDLVVRAATSDDELRERLLARINALIDSGASE